jgi:type II secretory pathway pseudopilin PulG
MSRAFTLVELLIILAILAAFVIPQYTTATQVSRAAAMTSNVRLVRGFIAMHAIDSTIELSEEGFPTEIQAEWFPRDVVPDHSWTGQPMIIAVVDAGEVNIFPGSKVFDTTDPTAANAWYNPSNGAFCALVPAQSTDAATLDVFNSANSTAAATIHQTTR